MQENDPLRSLHLDQRNAIYTATGQRQVAVSGGVHVAHDTSTGWDRPGLELLCLGIEAHERSWLHARLAVPQDIVHSVHTIGLRLGTTGRGPLACLAGRGIEPAQIATDIVRMPEHVVAGNGYTAWTGLGMRQHIFVDGHRVRINAGDFVAAELDEEGYAFGIHHHAIGPRFWCRRRHQLYLTRLQYEPPHHVASLHCEPERALLVEDRRVRVTCGGIGHGIYGHLSGFRVELADVTFGVARIPDVAVFVGGQAMRTCMRRLEAIFRDLARSGIQPPEHVGELPCIPVRSHPVAGLHRH